MTVDSLDSLRCPLLGDLLYDAVVTPYGHSFNKSSIEEWLSSNSICPITRKPLSFKDLIPNYAVRDFLNSINTEKMPTKSVTNPDSSRCIFEQFLKDNKALSAINFQIEELKTKQLELDSKLKSLVAEKTLLSESMLGELDFNNKKAMNAKLDSISTEETAAYIELSHVDHDLRELLDRQASVKKSFDSLKNQLTNEISNQSCSLTREEVQQILEEDKRSIRMDMATKLKDKGNEHFKNQNYSEAIALYTQAIDELSPFSWTTLYLNRAAAYQATKQYEKSINDCNQAIKIDPDCWKAHRRLGAGHVCLGQFTKASIAYTRALELNDEDKESKRMLKWLEDRMKPREPVEQTPPSFVSGNNGAPRSLGGLGAFFEPFGAVLRPFDDAFSSFFR
ncbi:hypothetical protein P9112_007945 [Eukaryota sp. TZLM1-RC]